MPYYDITDETLAELGLSLAGNSGAAAVPTSIRWDCSIGGLPFLFGFSDQYPLKRETASFRRDRVDTERNPGEQSLDSGFWLRSQSSWHYGSGLTSAEPLEVSEKEAQFRYQRGGGVNVWTAGQVTLLNDTESEFTSTGTSQHLIGVDTGVLHADGTTVTYVTTSSATAVTWGGSTQPVTSLASDGANYFAANSVGIYKGALPSGAGSLIWNTGATTVARWVKSRLMAAIGASLYELTGTGPTLPTALFTHPNSGWVWTDIAEGPSAIYVAGYSGDTSLIYKIGVNTSTSAITLNQPVVVAELPRGELVRSLYSYVGTYIVIGTSKGARVAAIRDDGSLTFGPLVVESTDGCLDAVADGSFVYVTMGTQADAGDRVKRAGLARIDLGTTLNQNPLNFAAAADLVCPSGLTGSTSQVTTAGGKVWFTVTGTGGGVFRQNNNYVSNGWIETGRIRLGTVEAKAWRDIRVLSDESSAGTIAAHASTSTATAPSTWSQIVSITSGTYDLFGSLNAVASTPVSALYVAIKLTRGSATTTPVLTGYQVVAIPAPKRTELVQVPLMLFDYEVDRQGVKYGKPGSSRSRYQILKLMEGASNTVQWRDFTTGETSEAFIEQVSYSRTSPPTRQSSGSGGIVTVTMRLV